MENFLQTGLYTQGCIIPVTTEDPSLVAVLDDFSEEFRINIFIGSTYITSVNMINHRQICNDVSTLLVQDRYGKHLGNIHSLIKEQLYCVYMRIHN